jgi:hypothetical protein
MSTTARRTMETKVVTYKGEKDYQKGLAEMQSAGWEMQTVTSARKGSHLSNILGLLLLFAFLIPGLIILFGVKYTYYTVTWVKYAPEAESAMPQVQPQAQVPPASPAAE